MPIWESPAEMVNLDTLLSQACPEQSDKDGYYVYYLDAHCVRFAFTAKPELRVLNDNGEYRYTVYRIKAWSSQEC